MEYQLKTSLLSPQYLSMSAIEQVFANRGLSKEEAYHYQHTDENDLIDPSSIKNIKEGVATLIAHIANNDLVFIQVDSDCDGYTSSAILLNYLHDLFPAFIENQIIIGLHEGKQHGIDLDIIPEAVKLVIAPDSSSNDYIQHQILKERGCDVLVIDHHEAEKYSKNAVVINNQMCDYPTKSLSGAGMVLKFCQYIDKCMDKDYAKKYFDLAALGIIADVMDVRDFETREIIRQGLSHVNNILFTKMCEMQSYQIESHSGLNPFTIGWYISPLINAVNRTGTMEEKRVFFEAMLDYKAYDEIPSTKRGCKGQTETKVEQAVRSARNIKAKQDKSRDASVELIKNIIETKHLVDNKIIAVKLPKGQVNRNFTGLIANQLLSEYKHPILLLSEIRHPSGEVCWEGSARSYDCEGLDNFKEFLKNNSYVYLSEGHKNAFGVGLTDEGFNAFIKETNEELKDCTFTPSYDVDYVWDANEVDPDTIISLAELFPLWGQGLDEPEIVVSNILITNDNLKLMGADKAWPLLKITLPNGVECIKRYSSQEEFDSFTPPAAGATIVTIVATCSINKWGNKETPQLVIKDYNLRKQQYFF